MGTKRTVFVVAAVCLIAGCGDDETSSGGGPVGGASSGGEGPGGAGASGGGGEGAGGGGAGGDGGGGAAAETASVRVAHLSPDAPAVDFCLLPESGAPIGPVLENLAGTPEGVAYPSVTAYLPVAPGNYGVRVIAPSATTCDAGLLPDIPGLSFAANQSYTAAAIGMLFPAAGDAAFELIVIDDDNSIEPGKVRMRFIHTSPDVPPVDVGIGSGAAFTPVWTNVAYPNIGLVMGQPYVSVDPPTNAQISARATGTTTDALVIDNVTIPPDQVVTTFAIGNLDGAPAPLKVLACLDVAGFCLELPEG